MFGGPEGLRRIMEQETSKPMKIGDTLARLGAYFKPYWLLLILVVGLVIVSTWAQVTTPVLIGQVVDCYLAPAPGGSAASFPGAPTAATENAPTTGCWLAEGQEPVGFTQQTIDRAVWPGRLSCSISSPAGDDLG